MPLIIIIIITDWRLILFLENPPNFFSGAKNLNFSNRGFKQPNISTSARNKQIERMQ